MHGFHPSVLKLRLYTVRKRMDATSDHNRQPHPGVPREERAITTTVRARPSFQHLLRHSIRATAVLSVVSIPLRQCSTDTFPVSSYRQNHRRPRAPRPTTTVILSSVSPPPPFQHRRRPASPPFREHCCSNTIILDLRLPSINAILPQPYQQPSQHDRLPSTAVVIPEPPPPPLL